MRPAGAGPLYLRRLGGQAEGDFEYVMDAAPAVLRLGDLRAQPLTTVARGAAQESFRLLFSLPFSQQNVDEFVEPPAVVVEAPAATAAPPAAGDAASGSASPSSWRRPVAFGLFAVGAAAAAGGTWAVTSALEAQERHEYEQAGVYNTNKLIERHNTWARTLYGIRAPRWPPGRCSCCGRGSPAATNPPSRWASRTAEAERRSSNGPVASEVRFLSSRRGSRFVLLQN